VSYRFPCSEDRVRRQLLNTGSFGVVDFQDNAFYAFLIKDIYYFNIECCFSQSFQYRDKKTTGGKASDHKEY
jgi:hypothetical protein